MKLNLGLSYGYTVFEHPNKNTEETIDYAFVFAIKILYFI